MGERDGAHEVARVVSPDVVAALVVQPLHRRDRLLQGLPFGGVAYVVVVQRKMRVFAALDVPGDVAHQRVEVLCAVDQPSREHELGVLLVLHLERDLMLREHVASAEP